MNRILKGVVYSLNIAFAIIGSYGILNIAYQLAYGYMTNAWIFTPSFHLTAPMLEGIVLLWFSSSSTFLVLKIISFIRRKFAKPTTNFTFKIYSDPEYFKEPSKS